MKTSIIIPVTNLADSKTSFSPILGEKQRKEFTLTMLEDILNVVEVVDGVQASVVTPDESVLEFVEEKGHESILEPGLGLNRALEMAIGEAMDSGHEQVLIMPVDVPLIRPEEIRDILDLAEGEQSIVLTPSEENGTNALLLRPPDVIELKFGGESFPEHLEEAIERGIDPEIYPSRYIERDLDDPSNLLKVEIFGKGTKTHSFLDNLKTEK